MRVSRLGLLAQLPGDASIADILLLRNNRTGELDFLQVCLDTGLHDGRAEMAPNHCREANTSTSLNATGEPPKTMAQLAHYWHSSPELEAII
ncbi:hypothetical protein IQ268_23205 [Oculatella sp. LEGE 06141]|uniref:hypothetical protein n=1 Tax=Oculatella sp. LEGE 06141 TaxID=1828648 RepID=UPI00187FD2B3|nr:hypothetical protein [Oculatella sp. LEGE 06141]MBE9181476.1 hypothetical protein [Oculatella sp. LEGE 06141]